MWHDLVLEAGALVGQLVSGFVSTFTCHPILAVSSLAGMAMVHGTLWIEVLQVRLDILRSTAKPPHPRPIRLKR